MGTVEHPADGVVEEKDRFDFFMSQSFPQRRVPIRAPRQSKSFASSRVPKPTEYGSGGFSSFRRARRANGGFVLDFNREFPGRMQAGL